jgi:pimeloyl-ACP methyl ester carboxylesterase
MKIGKEHIAVICAAVIGGGAGLGLLLYLASAPQHPTAAAPSPVASTKPAPSAPTAPAGEAAPSPPEAAASTPAPSAVATAAAKSVPRIDATDCWFTIPAGRAAHCGTLVVAERYKDAKSRPLNLRFVVFEGTGSAHASDPVIFISGGPGDPAQIDARGVGKWFSWVSRAAWLGERDLVVFDQRGVGVSEPKMSCPELAEAGYKIFPQPMPRSAESELWAAAAQKCRDRLTQSGLDLTLYNTKAIVEDLRQLIELQGYTSWTFFAVSYGTRVALNFIREHPQGTRAIILDSVYPPDARFYVDGPKNGQRAFQELFKECGAEAACNASYPKLAESFDRLVRRAAATPIELSVTDPRTGKPVTVKLDDGKLVETLFYGLYEWRVTQQIPAVISTLEHGDPQLFAPLAASAFASYASEQESHGLFLSVECHDEYPFNDHGEVVKAAEQVPLLKSYALGTVPLMACPSWPVGRAEDRERQSAQSVVPTLIFVGELDPAVSPDWAKLVSGHLAHATTLRFRGIGHGVVAAHACADLLIGRFLADSSKSPYDDCLLGIGSSLFSHSATPQ